MEQRATAVYQVFKSLPEWEVSPVKGGFIYGHIGVAVKPEDWQVFYEKVFW